VTAKLDLHAATGRLSSLVETVPDHALDWPTPCEHYTVADLLDHIDGFALAFAGAAAKRPLEGAPSAGGDRLAEGWQARIPTDLAALAEAWDDPDAWTGMTRAGGVDLPGEVAGVVALDELVIHGWDLAKAIGQPAAYGGPELDAVFGLVEQFGRDGVEGPFGPAVPVDETAPLLDRIVGLAGRDPNWEPEIAG
jgi:uncharacterized protein (TIGR03086 family)